MSALPLLIGPISQLLDKLIPDPLAREKARAELQQMDLQAFQAALSLDQAQANVNAAEAASPSMFVAGWRPFIGWVCGVAFTYHYVLQPFLAFVYAAQGHPIVLPEFDMESMTTVLIGMLGLGGLRTYEKLRLQ